MALGFPAYHEESAHYPDVPRANLRRVAEDAIDDIGWTWRRDAKWQIIASVPASMVGIFVMWGERLIVRVLEEELFVRSEGSFPLQWLDFGKHQANVTKFLDRVEDLLEE